MRSTFLCRLFFLGALVWNASSAHAEQTLLGVLGGAQEGADDAGALVRIDPINGMATVIGTPLPGRGLTGVASDAAGRVFAVTDSKGPNGAELIEVDPLNGALVKLIGALQYKETPVVMHDIAIQPQTGVIFGSAVEGGGLSQNDLVTIDRSTAEVTLIGNPALELVAFSAIGFAPDGTLWSKIANYGNFWILDPSSAKIVSSRETKIGGLGFAIQPKDGRMILSECCSTDRDRFANDIYSLDTATGEATLLGPAGGTRRVHDLTFVDPDRTNLVDNGGFEAGNLQGWSQMDSGKGSFFAYQGSLTPESQMEVLPPPEGYFAALSDQSDPGTHILYQDVAIPAAVANARLSALVYVENRADGYVVADTLAFDADLSNQHLRMDVMDPEARIDDVGEGVLLNVFTTLPGTPNSLGYTAVNADLSPFAGKTVRLRIAEVDNLSFLNGAVDEIAIRVGTPGSPVFPPTLTVEPIAGASVYRKIPGPFVPDMAIYTLRNTGSAALNFAVSSDSPWLDVSPLQGLLQPRSEQIITLALNENALGLSPDVLHKALVTFTNQTSGLGNAARQVTASVVPTDGDWDIATDEGIDDSNSLTVRGLEDGGRAVLRLTLRRGTSPQSSAGRKGIEPPANIGFGVMTSTEEDKDVLTLTIDGQPVKTWSGENDWTEESLTLPPPNLDGENELEWSYDKDGSGSAGDDAVYVDGIEILDHVILASSVLPGSRSGQVGNPLTAFATMVNAGSAGATECLIEPSTSIPATFDYQTTDPLTNALVGPANTPADIPPGGLQSYVVAFTPTAVFAPTDVVLRFDCSNSAPASTTLGLNTLLLSASSEPVPDIVVLAATLTGDGIANIPGTMGTGLFAVATVNVGSAGTLNVSADTGMASLPVALSVCETNPVTAQCLAPPSSSVTTSIAANATPTFAVFITGSGQVPFDPAANRAFVRFTDGGGAVRGSASVAVRTQ